MSARLVVYDADNLSCEQFESGFSTNDVLFSATPAVKPCIGCFGCWIKTPGVCVLGDRCNNMPRLLLKSDDVVVISPIKYGGLSRDVKAVLDRSIGYLLPYFRIVSGEMHHVMRYDHAFRLDVHLYGNCPESERTLARRLVQANAVNFGASDFSVHFYDDVRQAKEAIL